MTVQGIFLLVMFGVVVISMIGRMIVDRKAKKEQEALNQNERAD